MTLRLVLDTTIVLNGCINNWFIATVIIKLLLLYNFWNFDRIAYIISLGILYLRNLRSETFRICKILQLNFDRTVGCPIISCKFTPMRLFRRIRWAVIFKITGKLFFNILNKFLQLNSPKSIIFTTVSTSLRILW